MKRKNCNDGSAYLLSTYHILSTILTLTDGLSYSIFTSAEVPLSVSILWLRKLMYGRVLTFTLLASRGGRAGGGGGLSLTPDLWAVC